MAEQERNHGADPAPRRRKARGGAGRPDPAENLTGREPAASTDPAARKDASDRMRAGYGRAEEKNQAARDALKPLSPGERPGAVTIGAILSSVIAVTLWVSCAVAVLTGAKVNGESVNVTQWAFLAAIVTLMAWGMWRIRYWAVLGFQMALVLLVIAGVLGLVMATSLVQILSTAIMVIALSVLFWFMVKAMARVQMPQRPSGR